MRSPEEVWGEIEDGFDSVTQWGISDDQRDHAADLIRTRDAEVAEQVRAETRRANTTAVPSRAFVSPWDAEP